MKFPCTLDRIYCSERLMLAIRRVTRNFLSCLISISSFPCRRDFLSTVSILSRFTWQENTFENSHLWILISICRRQRTFTNTDKPFLRSYPLTPTAIFPHIPKFLHSNSLISKRSIWNSPRISLGTRLVLFRIKHTQTNGYRGLNINNHLRLKRAMCNLNNVINGQWT